MFGTLSIQPKEPLTFVENTDLAATLSRNQRYKPHVSCDHCRARKTRCTGEPSGCDRCVASSAECRYPDREVRRKRRTQRSLYDDYGTNSNPDGATTHGTRAGGVEADDGTYAHDRMDSADALIQDAHFDPAIFGVDGNHDAKQHQIEQHHVEQWLSSNMDPTSEPGSRLDSYELDNWSGMGSFLGLPPNALYDAAPDASDAREDAGQGQSLEGTDTYSDANDRNPDFSSGRYSMPAIPMGSAMGSLVTALASPTHAQSDPSRSSSNNTSNKDRDGPSKQDMTGYVTLGARHGDWPARSQPAANNRGQRSTPSEERRKTQASRSSTRRQRNSGQDSSSSFASHISPGNGLCRCCTQLVYLLEELAAKLAAKEPTSMDMLFGVLRHAIAQCKDTTKCQRCHGMGETSILLALVCQYISALYVTVVKCCTVMLEDLVADRSPERPEPQQRPSFTSGPTAWSAFSAANSDSGGASNGLRSDTGADMWYSTYRIESSCERMHVLMTLVTVQITEFSDMLGSLRFRVCHGTNQMAILSEAVSQTTVSKRTLRNSIDRAIASKDPDV